MTDHADVLLRRLLADPPRLHQHPDGQLIADWRIDDRTAHELSRRLRPGLQTLETGAGFSTILFAGHACDHTCIAPDPGLVQRIQDYCREHAISTHTVRFVPAMSADAVPQLPRAHYDLALIDGCHGFPTAYVDFFYASRALRQGGTLVIDDLHIYTCQTIARFLQVDAAWRVEVLTKRVAFAVKLDDTGGVDGEWHLQPFVRQRSRATSYVARLVTSLGLY